MSQTNAEPHNPDPNELDDYRPVEGGAREAAEGDVHGDYQPPPVSPGSVPEANEADVLEQAEETPLTERRGGVHDEPDFPDYDPDED